MNITDAELSQAKSSISLLTQKLKELRKEVELCQDIAVRSKVIEEKVDAVRAEEEKSKPPCKMRRYQVIYIRLQGKPGSVDRKFEGENGIL